MEVNGLVFWFAVFGALSMILFTSLALTIAINDARVKLKEAMEARRRCPHCYALTRGFKPLGSWNCWCSANYCSRCGASMRKHCDEEVA